MKVAVHFELVALQSHTLAQIAGLGDGKAAVAKVIGLEVTADAGDDQLITAELLASMVHGSHFGPQAEVLALLQQKMDVSTAPQLTHVMSVSSMPIRTHAIIVSQPNSSSPAVGYELLKGVCNVLLGNQFVSPILDCFSGYSGSEYSIWAEIQRKFSKRNRHILEHTRRAA